MKSMMKIQLSGFVALLTLVVPAVAATVEVDWNTFLGFPYNDGGDIVADSSGNVYVTNTSIEIGGTFAGNKEIVVAKFDSSGNLSWNTFLGSSSDDYGHGIVVDENGNVYVTGRSDATWGNPVNHHAGGTEAFVAKLDNNGNLSWNTFLGSSDYDEGRSIAVSDNGNVYITGFSGVSWGSPVNAHSGSLNAFIAQLSSSSGNLSWNTFLGSSGDSGYGIVTSNSNAVYVTGYSQATWGNPVNSHAGNYDAFVAKLSSSGNLNWNTFMGSSNHDSAQDLIVGDNDTLYVTGYSQATWGSPVNAYAGSSDIFIAQLSSISGNLDWNTFIGSSETDSGYGIAVSDNGTVYVTGYSAATWGSPVNAYAGNWDVVVAQLSNSGNLSWNTFLGSSSGDSGRGLVVYENSTVYVTGHSSATWGTPLNSHSGSSDAFVAKLKTSDLSYLQFSLSTYQATENSGQAVIKVTRTGNTDGAVSVNYASSDDTAVDGSDYTTVAGTLNWEDGDSDEKSFIVNLIDDSEVEGDESIILMLGNVTGGAVLGTPDTATLVIVDDDQSESECKHAIYLLEDQMLAIPAVEVPILSVIDQQPTGETTLLTGILKQHPTELTQFSILFLSEVFPETIAAASNCPATYSLTSGVLSVPWVDMPVVGQLGSEQSEAGVEVFRVIMQWKADLKHFVVEQIQRVE